MIRQLQRNYPPYPCDIGVYHPQPAPQPSSIVSPSHVHSHQPYKLSPSHQSMPTPMSTQPMLSQQQQSQFKPLHLELHSNTSSPFKGQRHPSILKNYKSCPVSPVHEEMDWTSMDGGNDAASVSHDQHVTANEKYFSKRHSMYSDDAKTILDKIHADTEQMIAEIKSKYGDLDNPKAAARAAKLSKDEPSKFLPSNPFHPKNLTKLQQEEDIGNFSSDSLEDCSLDLSAGDKYPMRTKKSICRKKHRKYETNTQQSSFPKRSVSDYYICGEFDHNNYHRNISLSDILNDDDDKAKKDYAFMNSQRHSSASFFLAPERRSQESLLSDDLSGCGVSYCNSMESILSDESDCKSAPLEVLFGRTKRDFYRYPGNHYDASRADANCSSKSYGSSPNNGTSTFDYFMEHQHQMTAAGYSNDAYNTSSYGCYDSFVSNARIASRCAPPPTLPLPPPPLQFQNKISSHISSYPKSIPTSSTFPSISEHSSPLTDEFIPRLGSKSMQYTAQMNRSLSKEFANERQQNNSNPMYDYMCSTDEDFFVRKTVDTSPAQSMPSTMRNDQLSTMDTNVQTPANQLRKSCSFEIELFHNRGKALQQKCATKKYEQNLEKFEKDRNRGRGSSQFDSTLEMSYVPHKPPVANRRTASVKTKRGLREKDRYHTVGQIKCSEFKSDVKLANKEMSHSTILNDSKERSIELYVVEASSVDDDDNMDSLELYAKPNLYKENSVDSLDDLGPTKQSVGRKLMMDRIEAASKENSIITEDFLSQAEYLKFRDIEKKIDVINKLVEMEEKKLEQERMHKELRMRPFKANAQKKGYVKSLTMNFDNLAKTMKYENDLSQKMFPQSDIKRNYSLPDVLEVAKYQFLCDGEFNGSVRERIGKFLVGKPAVMLIGGDPNSINNEGARSRNILPIN